MGTAGSRAWARHVLANAATRALRELAPTASLSVVMAYLSSPTTAAADRPPAMDDRNRSRRPVQWPRLNALSLVPPGARRPRPARVRDVWSGPRATRAPLDEPFRPRPGAFPHVP